MNPVTLKNAQVTLANGKISIVADVVEEPFNDVIVSRVTHGFISADNINHPRLVQSSNAAVFVRHGQYSFNIPNDILVQIAAIAAPLTSFPPVFKSGVALPSVEVSSETPYTIQWQMSDDAFPKAEKPNTPPPEAVWTDIAGQTRNVIDTNVLVSGKWIRCVATNLTGKTIGKAVQWK